MDINYHVYLDNIEIDELPKGLESLDLTIIREDGFGNSEQILRETTSVQLDFEGDGYKYICQKRKENYCTEISIKIIAECNGKYYELLNGLIKQTKVKVYHKKCILKIDNIKDNSFSGLIRDWIATEISLYNLRTRNCYDLTEISKYITTPTIPNTYTIDKFLAFDCLDIIDYLVKFFTDNKFYVKSDYLINNKYAITTGYNLHNTVGNLNRTFPKVSISSLFKELRAFGLLYMIIEYDNLGNPYLRIEPEDYFYKDEIIYTIDTIPSDITEYIDERRIFNTIINGSSNTKIKDNNAPVVPQDRLYGWNKETFINCGVCSSEKENELDIVNNYIIDSNLIDEAMLEPIGSDYNNDENIYLLNYYTSGGINYLVGNNANNYNENINNYNKLLNWIGHSGNCLVKNYLPQNYFKGESIGTRLFVINPTGATGFNCGANIINFDTIYDLLNNLSVATINVIPCAAYPPTDTIKYFKAPTNGNYKFKAFSSFIQVVNINEPVTYSRVDVTYKLRIKVYLDDTFTTEIYTPFEVSITDVDDALNNQKYLEITQDILLASGNCVCYQLYVEMPIQAPFTGYNVLFKTDSGIELLEDDTTCDKIEDTINIFKPFISEFTYPLCLSDYLSIKDNKVGYINVFGNKMWIKEIGFKHNGLTSFKLIHQKSICNCIT